MTNNLLSASVRVIYRPKMRRMEFRVEAIRPALDELERKYAGDHAALERERAAMLSRHEINPLPGIALWLGSRVAFDTLCVLVSRDRRSLPDRLAGTAIAIQDP